METQKPIIHFMEQGSEEWLAIRAGRITGTAAKTFLVNGKGEGGLGAGALTEIDRIIEEKLTGKPRMGFSGGKAADFGHEWEGIGREDYEVQNFVEVKQVGFISLGEYIGCSPDGLVGDDGGFENKSLPKEHIGVVRKNKPLAEHVEQCEYCLFVSGRKWWDLHYFHPEFPEKTRRRTFRILPNPVKNAIWKEKVELAVEIIERELKILS